MKKIAVFGFDESADVIEGLAQLITDNPDAVVYLPMQESNPLAHSILLYLRENKIKHKLFISAKTEIGTVPDPADIIICQNPIKEVMRSLTSEDILAMVWDDSPEAHVVLHSLEDFGMDTWDISHGLNPIEIDFDEDDNSVDNLYEEMLRNLDGFIESLTAFVTGSVLEILTSSILDRIAEEEGSRDINPFDDDL